MIPHPAFLRGLLDRSALIWLGIRGFLYFTRLFGSASLPASIAVVIFTATFAILDERRRQQTIFLANLGVSELALVAVAAVPPIVLEGLMHTMQ